MGFLSKLFRGKKDEGPPEIESPGVNLAMPLLACSEPPNARAIRAFYAEFANDGSSITHRTSEEGDEDDPNTQFFSFSTGEQGFFGLMPGPIPVGEAEDAVRFSMSHHTGDWQPPDHRAQPVVSTLPMGDGGGE